MSDLEAARRETIRLLCLAQADDQLSVETFESRLDLVRQAPNQATLAAILADLDLPPATGLVPAVAAPPPLPDLPPPVAPAEVLRVTSVFGETKRAGSWTVPHVLEARVLFGNMTIDLRDAVFGADLLEIDVDVKLGAFTLIVPPGTQIENEVADTLSESSHKLRRGAAAPPNGLLVRLGGSSLLASVTIKEKERRSDERGLGFLSRLLGTGDDG